MSLVFTAPEDILSVTYTGLTTTQTSAAWVARQPHDQLLLEVGVYTLNSGSGTVQPSLLFAPTFDGTYSELFGDADILSATTTAPVRYHLTDVNNVLTGFYKLVMTVAGTVNFTGSLKIYPARRCV